MIRDQLEILFAIQPYIQGILLAKIHIPNYLLFSYKETIGNVNDRMMFILLFYFHFME